MKRTSIFGVTILLFGASLAQSYTMTNPPPSSATGLVLDTAKLKFTTNSPPEVTASACNRVIHSDNALITSAGTDQTALNVAMADLFNNIAICINSYILSDKWGRDLVGNLARDSGNSPKPEDIRSLKTEASDIAKKYLTHTSRTSTLEISRTVRSSLNTMAGVSKIAILSDGQLTSMEGLVTEMNNDLKDRNTTLDALETSVNNLVANTYDIYNNSYIVQMQNLNALEATFDKDVLKLNNLMSSALPSIQNVANAADLWATGYTSYTPGTCGDDAFTVSNDIQTIISGTYTDMQTAVSTYITDLKAAVDNANTTVTNYIKKFTDYMDVAEEFIGLTLPTTPVLSSSNTNTRPGTVLASVSSSPTRISPTDPASSRNKLSGLKISSPASADLKDKMAKTNATLYNSNDNKFFLSDIKLGTPNTDPMVDKNAFSTKFKTTSQSLSNGIDAAVNLWLPTSSEMIIINKAKSLLTENQDRVVALGKIGVYVHLKVNNALTRPATMPEIEDFPKMSDIKVVCDDVVMPFLKELNDFNNFLKKIDTDLRTLPSELYKSAFSAATFTTLLTGYTNYVSTEVPNLVKLADNCKSFTTEMDSAMSRYMSFVNNDIKRLSDDIKKTQDFMTARVNLFNRRFKGLATAMIQATKDVASITEHNDFHAKFVKNLFTQFNPASIALPAVSTFTATMNWKVQTININPDNTIRLYTEDVFAAPATPSTETVYYLPVDISASRTTTTTATTTPPASPILHVCTFIPPPPTSVGTASGTTPVNPCLAAPSAANPKNPNFFSAAPAVETGTDSTAYKYFAVPTPNPANADLAADYNISLVSVSNNYVVFKIRTQSKNLLTSNLAMYLRIV